MRQKHNIFISVFELMSFWWQYAYSYNQL